MNSSDDAKQREDLIEAFGVELISDDALLAECINLCQMFNITPADLHYKWEALNFNSKAAFDMNAVRELKAQMLRQNERKAEIARLNQRVALSNPTRGGLRMSGAGILNIGRFSNGLAGTPVKTEPGRTTAFQVKEDHKRPVVAGPSKVKFEGPPMSDEAKKGRAYRYMYEKISDRSEILDDRIEEFSEIMRDHYGIDDFGDPSATSEEDVYVIGRIALDAETSSSGAVKLNEASLALESSRMMGSGSRVQLKFDVQTRIRGGAQGAAGLGLFPGAIAALRGKNGGGGWFLVKEILSLPPMKLRDPPQVEQEGSPFSMVIACGPYTPDADLSYSPWRALLSKLKSTKPAVTLLLGPFVDSSHPRIKDGDVDDTPEVLFRSIFVDSLGDFLDLSPGSIALLVPSVRDIISDHVVLPQSELPTRLVDDPRIHLLPNPCFFTLGTHTFRVTSVDVLFHLRKEEFIKRAEETDSTSFDGDDLGSDSMGGLCRHVLRQRSLYPVYPTPLDLAQDVNLDVSHLDGLAIAYNADDPAPDILVLPSRYKHFSKTVDGTLAINPSIVAKGIFSSLTLSSHKSTAKKDSVKVDFVKVAD